MEKVYQIRLVALTEPVGGRRAHFSGPLKALNNVMGQIIKIPLVLLLKLLLKDFFCLLLCHEVGAFASWMYRNAFLNGVLEKDVYMRQPPGYESKEAPRYLCKLDKALYGLKKRRELGMSSSVQSFSSQQLGFCPSKADISLFFNKRKVTIFCLYMLIISQMQVHLKNQQQHYFAI